MNELWTAEQARKLADEDYLRHTHGDVWEAIHDLADALDAQQAELTAADRMAAAVQEHLNIPGVNVSVELVESARAYDALRQGSGEGASDE